MAYTNLKNIVDRAQAITLPSGNAIDATTSPIFNEPTTVETQTWDGKLLSNNAKNEHLKSAVNSNINKITTLYPLGDSIGNGVDVK